MDLSSQRVIVLHDIVFFFTCGFDKSYGSLTLHGMGLGQVEGMGLELMSPNKKYTEMFTLVQDGKRNLDQLFPIVPDQFPVPVPVPVWCSVNKPL